MSTSTYFVQHCPTCGRGLQIRVEYLGRKVVCQHCGGRLVASDSKAAVDLSESGILMRRADELLELASRQIDSTRGLPPTGGQAWS
jgi:DNA-directed RNA polymerase subunit RPC12/RpoP